MDAPSRLFACDILDAKDDWEQDLLQCYTKFNDDKAGKSEMELHAYLQEKASQKEGYTKLMSGLFYGALVEPDAIGQYFQYITIVNRDQYVSVKDRLYVLVKSIRFSALHRPVIGSILWIYNELTKMSVLSMDGLYIWLVRQIRGGVDLSPNNLYLCDQVLRLVEHHQAWFDSFPRLLASIVYLYLRLIPEHRNIQASPLQQKEIRFVITMLRQKWPVCSLVGRDLVRGLQDVYHIPDFKHFWNDMNHRPQQISPSFKGIHCLLKTPTAKEFLRVRLTPDMEHKLMFILQELRFNSFQRNLNWFIQRFMGNAEAEGFIVDIVRFIIAGWYPNNQLLQSDVVPRYVVIGSLIRTIKSAVVSSNVKLALTFDWLFFNPNDNLMLIEPVMLLIERSAEKYPHITSTMIEFIYHASNEYFLQLKEDMRRSLATGMRVMLKMQVTRSLVPLYQCSSLEPPVKQMIMELFGEFLQVPFTSELPPPADNDSTVASMPSTVEQSSAAEQPVSLNANVTPMDVDTMPKPDQLEVADVTLSAPDQEAVTKPTKQQEQILVADTAVPLDTNLLSKNGDVDMSGAIDAEPSAKVMSGSSAPQPLPTLPNISVSANCTTISSDALKAICTSEDEYSDSDVDLDGPGGKDQQLSTNRQNQSNWIFGDAIGRFKSASASFLTVWPGDQDEASVQLIIAKRSLKEILDVYMSMVRQRVDSWWRA
ncbi:hypothetical protein DM01DRAFT_9307 [Hesseltinella vesiculosa]|uniref:Integrator complex subunit 3 N-terminal domain-containing protein n=1 Tax=Hesseltinella vesiculosa TaxID=101127 RepID=A0A1X2GGU2_9FUNG|nr:hypothetical protein DM01DRAFT_9307 [Hesseltinella vesiculosa]